MLTRETKKHFQLLNKLKKAKKNNGIQRLLSKIQAP